MTNEQQDLLLTVARIFRARVRDEPFRTTKLAGVQADDLHALNEALAPFDPSDEPGVNEASR